MSKQKQARRQQTAMEKTLFKRFTGDLNAITDELFALAERKKWSLSRLSKESNVAYQTLDKLWSRDTKRPHFFTVWKLATSLGVDIKFTSNALRILRRKAA